MEVAKIFENGRSQDLWDIFLSGINGFTEDIFEEGRAEEIKTAHAKSEGLTVVTNHRREFERVEGLVLENWAE